MIVIYSPLFAVRRIPLRLGAPALDLILDEWDACAPHSDVFLLIRRLLAGPNNVCWTQKEEAGYENVSLLEIVNFLFFLRTGL